jgi:polysaccharide deacetylase family protein (PEP-CTERM system associated)
LSLVNALSIDVEEYFQVSAFEGCVPVTQWHRFPGRVEQNTRLVLELLAERGVRATFFVLGWVAARYPELVREIHGAGHEVACHGNNHRRVGTQSRLEFREDVRSSKALLEDLTGERVLGYRAPSYSISLATLWAFDELLDAGYRYDSSVFPVRHDFYGIPHWPRFPFAVCRGETGEWQPRPFPGAAGGEGLLEYPITTLSLMGHNLPIAGGGYFRLFPYRVTSWGLRRINRVERRPFVFYLHPWELDPGQPRIAGAGAKTRFRHYLNLERTAGRFARLLRDFRFTTVRALLEEDSSPCAARSAAPAAAGVS